MAWLGEKAFRREAMGLGDAKLLAMIGAFTGPKGVLLAGVTGLALGLAVGLVEQARTKDPTFPFGPALAAGGSAAFLVPRTVGEGFHRLAGITAEPAGGLVVAAICFALLFAVRTRLPKGLFLLFLGLVLLVAALNGYLWLRGAPG